MPSTPALPQPLVAAPMPDRAGLVSDLLPLVDIGLLVAAALAAREGWPTGDLAANVESLPWVAIGLAPFMLYDRHFGALAANRDSARLATSWLLRALTWAAVVLGYAGFGDTLPGLHPPWLGTWLLGSLVLTSLARVAAASWLAGPPQVAAPPRPRTPRLAAGVAVTLLADRPMTRRDALLKAAQDRLLGGLIALLLLPLLAAVALAIRLDSPGPVLFRQRRHGLNNAEFDILKFRSMRWAPAGGGSALVQTTRGDARITRLGRWLRASSVDELPQLFNVLRGDMSLVGPRPHAVTMRTEDRLGTEITDTYPHRHRVKPGITGWAQVNGARGATDTMQQLQRRVELDLDYIDHWSIWLDLKILVMTFGVVFKRTNAF